MAVCQILLWGIWAIGLPCVCLHSHKLPSALTDANKYLSLQRPSSYPPVTYP